MKIQEQPPGKGKIFLSYSYLGIAYFIFILLISILYYIDIHFGLKINFTEYISLFSLGSIAIGLMYTGASLKFQYEAHIKKLEKEDELFRLDKIRFTYQITSDWFKDDISRNAELVRRYVEPYKGLLSNRNKLNEFNDNLKSEKGFETRKALAANLNYFENIALLLSENIIEESSLKNCFQTLFLQYYDNLKEYIEELQRGNGGHNGKFLINFVTLCKKWQANSN